MNRPIPYRILSTGGTFNKIYDPLTGTLEVDPEATALTRIATQWRTAYTLQTLIGKDSLEMDDADRQELLEAIIAAPEERIVVIHGTDTLDRSAAHIAQASLPKRVVLTGAMVPWSIDPVEATANLASAIGYALSVEDPGVFVAMNGCFGLHTEVTKDRLLGRFTCG